MSSEEDKVPQLRSWSELLSGGVPQLLIGPAGKAISRLIAGVSDIPAAWLEQKAQAIRDETEARTAVMKGLSGKAAELGIADEKLLARGLNSLLGKAFREQINREAVAKKLVEDLESKPPPENGSGPSDDWLNVFELYASQASSDRVRETLARVLAGEIRKPNSYSLQTLQLLAVLDQPTAQAARDILGGMISGDGIISERASGQRLKALMLLRDAGMISSVGMSDITFTTFLSGPLKLGVAAVELGASGLLLLQGTKGAKIDVNLHSVSRAAREIAELLNVVPSDDDVRLIVDGLPKENLTAIDVIKSKGSSPVSAWRKST